jgi:hypothetical protein
MIGPRIIRIQNTIIRSLDQDPAKVTISRNENLEPGQGLNLRKINQENLNGVTNQKTLMRV